MANVHKYDDIDLQNKAIEIHHEWSKAGDENWSHIQISLKYGHNSTHFLTKKLIFFQKSLNNAFANERIDAYLQYKEFEFQ